jgi:hypothetical protein
MTKFKFGQFGQISHCMQQRHNSKIAGLELILQFTSKIQQYPTIVAFSGVCIN